MDKNIKKFTYLKERKLWERLDILPFVIIQSLSLTIYTQENLNHLIKLVVFVILLIFQLIVFFSKFWSERLRAQICYKVTTSLDTATHVKIDITNEKFKMNNRTVICDIKRHPKLTLLELEKVNYIYNTEKQIFEKSRLNIKKPLGEFLEAKPGSEAEQKELRTIYGNNQMKIPIPSFFSLYKEHIVAPFFVFQLFCILLWVFDDYGIHSGMTLLMLCIFEATVVGQRIISLVTLRRMRVPPYKVFVYRDHKWNKISTKEIIPGDIISVLDGNAYEALQDDDEEESGNLVLSFLKKLKEIKKKAEEQRLQRSVNTVINRHKEKEPVPLSCDMLILSGSAIVNEAMLTGESVPQIKEAVTKMDHELNKQLDTKLKHKNCVLFAGTKVVKSTTSYEDYDKLPPNVKTPPPDNGTLCLVIKTGFSTSQGKLLRTVMYSSDRTQGDSKEAFIFIFFLLAIALMAAYYVLLEGIEREGEITYKLLLRCIIIITSVVPAELPIELSLAINNSLFFLQSKKIVCIEPFRIPYAGKIDICCFDKTGTLTKDEFIMKGVIKPDCSEGPVSPNLVNENIFSVLIGCNSLLQISGKLVGDPIELACFQKAGGVFNTDKSLTATNRCRVVPIRRYAFDATLKRMSVLVRFFSYNYSDTQANRILTKGAPENMRSLFTEVPDNYDFCYNQYAKQGYRILALGYADNPDFNYNSRREEVEQNLTFAGFILVETPLKSDTQKHIKELNEAEYETIIITGDHHLTTAKVALDLKIGPAEILFMNVDEKNKIINWLDLDGKIIEKSENYKNVESLAQKYMLGVTGLEMDKIQGHHLFEKKHMIFRYIKLFCRVNPKQKDDVVKMLIKAGHFPSMCGDGSNDVGALKRAVIGIALLNADEPEKDKNKNQPEQQFNILQLDEEGTIKSGDVTAAAPFTSKSGSIKCIKNIFIQGRCTLVITFQMFKILALNCLLSAYSLSVLALKGIKFSDYQSTYMGFLVAFLFLMLSKGEPLKKLNPNKPPYTIFSISSIISIIGQAVTHLSSLYLILYLTEQYDPININYSKSLDEPFAPTLMNSIIFIYQALNQMINFVVNYQGEPFMRNLSENKWMTRLSAMVVILSVIVVFDLHPQLNESLEILPFPDDMTYKISFVVIMIVDFLICYLLENWRKLFGYYKKILK
jgi:cation-transporting ATPase 13A1